MDGIQVYGVYGGEIWHTLSQILRYSPDCVLLVALDPVDVLSYLAWRVSGVHKGRVIGSGTNLSTATFRYLLADRLGLAPSACNGYIIGENGESSGDLALSFYCKMREPHEQTRSSICRIGGGVRETNIVE